MELARRCLTDPGEEAFAQFDEFWQHNELGLALDELAELARAQGALGVVWEELRAAATVMRLDSGDLERGATVRWISERLGGAGNGPEPAERPGRAPMRRAAVEADRVMSPLYWERQPDGPFATLIAVAATYLDPENYDLDSLRALGAREHDEEMLVFKSELRQALADPGQLPGDELCEAVEYDHGSDEVFLRWLWDELYGGQPTGGAAENPHHRRPRPDSANAAPTPTALKCEEPPQDPTMDNDIQLISDDDGLAVIGDPTAVEEFLRSEGLWASSKKLDLRRLKSLFGIGADVAQAASEIAANSARRLKLTPESAHLYQKYGLVETKMLGVSHAMVGKPGSIQKWLQVDQGAGSLLTNPAILSGAAGIMAQVAMQQSMADITSYLATIDEKVDDVLRKQDDAVVAQMVGTGHAIERAMTIREETGEVSQTRWSTVDQAHTHCP